MRSHLLNFQRDYQIYQISFKFTFDLSPLCSRIPKGTADNIPEELQPQALLIRHKLAELDAKRRDLEKLWGHPDSTYPHEGAIYPVPMDWNDLVAMRAPMEQSRPQYRHDDLRQGLTASPRRSRDDRRDRSPIRPDSGEGVIRPMSSHTTEAERSPVRRQDVERQMAGRPQPRDFEQWDPTGERDRSNQWDPRESPSSGSSGQWDPRRSGSGRPVSGGSDQFDPHRSSGRPSSGGTDRRGPSDKAGRPMSGDSDRWDPKMGRPASGSSDQWDPRRQGPRPVSGGSDQWDPRNSGSRPSSGSSVDQWDPVGAGRPSSGGSDQWDPQRRRQPPSSSRDHPPYQQSPQQSSRSRPAEKIRGAPPSSRMPIEESSIRHQNSQNQMSAPPSSRMPVEEGSIRPQSSQHQMSAPPPPPPPYRGSNQQVPSGKRYHPPSREGSPGDRGRYSSRPQSNERQQTALPSRRPVEQSPIRPRTAANQMAAPPSMASPQDPRRSTGGRPSAKREDPRDGFYGDDSDGYQGDQARLMRIPSTEDEALRQLQEFEQKVDEVSIFLY